MAVAGATVAQRGVLTEARIGGIAGLGFAAGVMLQNAVLLAGSPLPGSGLDEVVRFYGDNSGRIMIASGIVAINMLFLLTFISVVTGRMARFDVSALPGRVAYAGGIALLATFSTAAFLQLVLTSRIAELDADRSSLWLLWELHSGAFSMSGISLGVMLGSLAIGARLCGLMPSWTLVLGITGSLLALTGGALAFNVIDGGPALFLIFAGFAAWVVWLITASLRLVRSED
jgi:hypothetical protein